MKFESSKHIFEKQWNIKFHENPSSGSRVVPCGQTDEDGEANSCFSQILKAKNCIALDRLCNVRLPYKNVGYAGPKQS